MLSNVFTIKRLFDFRGRATRREYFLILVSAIFVWLALFALDQLLLGPTGPEDVMPRNPIAMIVSMIINLVSSMAIVVALFAALIRRVHDHDKSGWIILLNLVPFVGWIFWLILVLTPGNKYDNDYGPDPRDPVASEVDNLETIFS